jgi:hypothetical protein
MKIIRTVMLLLFIIGIIGIIHMCTTKALPLQISIVNCHNERSPLPSFSVEGQFE